MLSSTVPKWVCKQRPPYETSYVKQFQNLIVTLFSFFLKQYMQSIICTQNPTKIRLPSSGAFLTIFSLFLFFPSPFLLLFHVFWLWLFLYVLLLISPLPVYIHHFISPIHPSLAWQGTDLMHNHVLADDDQSSLDSLGRRSSLSRLEPSDLSEDSDYDSIWTAHSYRMGSTSRKSCCSYISHQN